MRNRAFTLIELIVVVAVLAMVAIGGTALFRGCLGVGSGQGSLIVNPYHASTAIIKVVKSYSMTSADEVSGNIYRVFCEVEQDSDGNAGEETMEIRDSWLDGNFMSADLFGKLVDGEMYKVTCRGERSGITSSFRGITSVEKYNAEASADGTESEDW